MGGGVGGGGGVIVGESFFAHLISSASFHDVIITYAAASRSWWTYVSHRNHSSNLWYFSKWTLCVCVCVCVCICVFEYLQKVHQPTLLEVYARWWTGGNYVTEAKTPGLEAIRCVNYTAAV